MTMRLLAAIVLGAMTAMPPASANTITVSTMVDGTGGPDCSLRDAIVAANVNTVVGGCTAGSPGADTIIISISKPCPITGCGSALTAALPAVTEDLDIDGGLQHPFISGEHLYRVFDLGAVTVKISNLMITNGEAGLGAGGGIRAQGTTLTLNHVNVLDGHATLGGGIFVEDGTLAVKDSVFDGNAADEYGGAINQAGGSVDVNGSSFNNNTAIQGGGAISATSSLTITGGLFSHNGSDSRGGALLLKELGANAAIVDSTFTNNYALGPEDFRGGGAIYALLGQLRMSTSTLAGNTSSSHGAALFALANITRLTNVTIAGNVARGSGGGIYANDGGATLKLDVDNATIVDNTADGDNANLGDGGGFFATGGTINIRNSIIAGNFDTPLNAGVGTVHPDCSGTLSVANFNLLGRNGGCAGIANGVDGNQVGTAAAPLDPGLDPAGPQNNGGPTQTIALLPCSPAIDKGKNSATDAGGQPILTDQRGTGFARMIDFPKLANAAGGDGTDIGAFEYAPKATLDIDASNAMTRYDPLTDGLLLLRYLFGYTGTPLTAGALGGTATRDADTILAYLDQNRMAFDADGNLAVDALTDGVLIVRYLSGLTGPALTQGAIGGGATRSTAPLVECYLGTLVP